MEQLEGISPLWCHSWQVEQNGAVQNGMLGMALKGCGSLQDHPPSSYATTDSHCGWG